MADPDLTVSKRLRLNDQESVKDAIELQEDDPRAVEAMINFMYGRDYDSSGNSSGRISPILFNIKVYLVADKYGIETLKRLSKEKFDKVASSCWDMDDFPHAITEVYIESSHAELQNTIAMVAHQHVRELLKKEDFQLVLSETSGFASHLLRLVTSSSGTTYRCPSCGGEWEARLPSSNSAHCLLCGRYDSDWDAHIVDG